MGIDMKNKCYCQVWNICNCHLPFIGILYWYIFVHTFKSFWHNEIKEEICLWNKEYISNHRCESTNIIAKCEVFVNVSWNLIGICENKYWCQTGNTNVFINTKKKKKKKKPKANMAIKCKIFVTVTLHYIGISIIYRYMNVQFEKLWHNWKKKHFKIQSRIHLHQINFKKSKHFSLQALELLQHFTC